jgi:hypothetical protein
VPVNAGVRLRSVVEARGIRAGLRFQERPRGRGRLGRSLGLRESDNLPSAARYIHPILAFFIPAPITPSTWGLEDVEAIIEEGFEGVFILSRGEGRRN